MYGQILVDVDYLLHRVCWACATDIVHEDEVITSALDLREAMRCFEEELAALAAHFRTPATQLALCASDPSRRYWRHRVLPSYKSSRTRPQPVGYTPLREKVSESYYIRWTAELEADDVMGLAATKGRDAVIVSVDKDMLTVPCRLVDPRTWAEKFVSEDEADFNHLLQVLTGDKADDVPGLKGIGPVRAKRILAGVSGARLRWERVVQEYAKHGLAEHDALRNARVLRILRAGDYDDERVRTWDPPVAG